MSEHGVHDPVKALASAHATSEMWRAHCADLQAAVKELLTALAAADGERDYWKQEYADQMIRPCHVAHHEDQEIEVEHLKAAVEQARQIENAAAVVENVLRGYAVDQREDVPERKALALADSLRTALTSAPGEK